MLQATPIFSDTLYQRKVHFEGIKLYSNLVSIFFVLKRIGRILLTSAFSGWELPTFCLALDTKHNSEKFRLPWYLFLNKYS